MAKDKSFHDYIVYDLLGDIPKITSRAMFGGHGVYKNGKIFAIIVHGELYLKANDEVKKFFSAHDSHAFTYSKKDGKTYTMNYWFVPEEIFEDRKKFAEWIDIAISIGK